MKSVYFNNSHAALEAVNHSNAAFVLFCAPAVVHELSEQIKQNTVLCAVAGEYCSQGYQSNIISGFEYDPQMAEIIPIDHIPAMSMKDMKNAYQKVKNNSNAFLLLLCDGLSKIEEKIITSLYFMDKDFKVIGGSAGDDLSFTETPIYIGREKVHSVGLFFDCKRRTYLTKENIYKPSGKEMLVTDADPMNRIVKTFNGNPASAEYARNLGVTEMDLNKYFMNHPLGIEYDSEIYIASSKDKQQSIPVFLLSNYAEFFCENS